MKRVLSFVLTVVMVVTMLPTAALGAEKSNDSLKEQLRASISDEQYPDGLFGFGKTQLSVKEGKKTKITVVRQGNTDKKATVHFKAIDVSAVYGEDYILTVKHSSVKKEQLEPAEATDTLMENNASVGDADTEVIVSEEEKEDKMEQQEAKGQEVSLGKKSGLAAAYELQNNEPAPENNWKETNPENAPEDLDSAMSEGQTMSLEALEQASGVETVLTFKPGEYKKEIICQTLDDDKAESDEQTAFFLYGAEGCEIGADYNGYVNIKDNEKAEDNIFAVESKNVTVEGDEDVAKVTIIRKSGINQMAFVSVGTKSMTALPGKDYEPVMEEVFFPSGSTSQTVEIPIIGDRTEEKSFYVGISEEGVVRDEENAASLVTIKKKIMAVETAAAAETFSQKEDKKDKTAKEAVRANNGGISAKTATTKNINITNRNGIGSGGSYVTSGIDFRFADKITVNYRISGNSYTKKCSKTTWYRDKRATIEVRNESGKTILSFPYDKTGQDSYSGTVQFTRNLESSKEFQSWDGLSNARIWAKAEGLNGNSNAQIEITSIEVNYPGFTFQVNNNSQNNYYTEKQFTQGGKYNDKDEFELGQAYFGNSTGNESTVLYEAGKLNLKYSFSGKKNSAGVPANGNTVAFKGYRLQKPNANNQYSEVIDLSNNTIDKNFLNKYQSYMYNGRTFRLVPVFEVKTANVTFNNTNAMVDGKANVKGSFKGYAAGSSLKNIGKLDTLVIEGAANAGYAVSSISLQASGYNISNADANNDKTSFTCGLGDNSNTSYTAYMNYEDASLKVMADPNYTNTESIRQGNVLYTDENNQVYTGDYRSPLLLNGIFMNTIYNIVGVAADGYRPVWRDGTLDYNEDGTIEDTSNTYKSFTPVKGNVLPYTTQTALSRIYYSFETQQEVGEPADIIGNVTLRDRYILTGEEYEKGINGANISVDGNQVQTSYGGTNKRNQQDGFFRVESDTFSVRDYYLVNVNAYGDEGSVNTSFVMNPGIMKECVIDTADDLTISNPVVSVKNGDEYVAQKITKDSWGYYSALTNGDKDYRLELKADKAGIIIKSGQLQFYDAEGKKLDKTVEAKAADNANSGHFYFDFNPQTLQLPSGTTLRVTFTDSQGHTYLQREVGMSLSQAVGNLDIANSFTFGGANTVVKVIGVVDSVFSMGWNGDFDDTMGDNVTNDEENGDKIITVGFNKELINNSDSRSTIEKAADSLAKKEQAVADANKELAQMSKKLAKKDSVTEDEQKEYQELISQVEKATKDNNREKEEYNKTVKNVQNSQKTTPSLASSANLEVGFSFMMTFGKDEKNQYYFKSMILTGSVTGGGSVTVKFSTPIGISINLGLAAGGDGTASFVVQERQDQLHPKKYYIQDIQENGSGEINVFDCNMNDANRKFDGYGSFTLNPYIQLSVGAGVLGDLIEVSISGAARFNMQFFTVEGENSGSVTLDSQLSVKVLMISHSWTLASTDIDLFGNSGAASLKADNQNYLYESANVLQPEDISYMKGGTRWKSGKIAAKSLDESKEAYQETNIADKIAENPDFKMISIGNGSYLAVFTNVDPTRAAVNAKAVYYTIYNANSGWSTPQKIEDDGTLDQYPDVFDLGDRGAVITWSSAEKVFDDNTSRIDMQNDLNLHCVFFDKKTKSLAGNIQEVTKHTVDPEGKYDDYTSDVSANVSYSGNKMIIYYQKKEYTADKEEYLGDVLFPQYSLMAARTYTFNSKTTGFGGQWDTYSSDTIDAIKQDLMNGGLTSAQAEERVKIYAECFYGQRMFSFLPSVKIDEHLDEEGYWQEGTQPEISEFDNGGCLIIDTDAISYNDLGVFAYTMDMDGNLDTSGDRDLYMQIYDFTSDSFMHPIIITSDNVEDHSIQFVRVPGSGKNQGMTYLTWLHDGDIVALNMSNIVDNYKTLLKKGTTEAGDTYYYINKTRPKENASDADIFYEAPMTIVEGVKADGDEAVSAITDFDVETSGSYVYFMWTQMNSTLKDGVEEGSMEASDPANALTETQMYTARYDVDKNMATKPVQVTSGKGANYNDITFAVEDDELFGLVYKADSKTLTLEEYNAMIEENNAGVPAATESGADDNAGQKASKDADKGVNTVDPNEQMETRTEYDYVPFSVVDTENAAPYSFHVDPKSVVKIKDAEFGELKAGQDGTLTFDILNDGIDTVKGLTLTAVDQKGESVLVGTKTNTTDDEGDANSDSTTGVVKSISLDGLIGGDRYSGVCQVPVEENDTSVEVTITVTDEKGVEIAKETVTEELESSIHLSDLKAEQTGERNQYRITGTIENDGFCKTKAGEIDLGSRKEEKESSCGKVEYPALLPGDSYSFEQIITISSAKTFVSQKDEEGNLTETGVIYAKAGDATAETTVERKADAEEMQKVNAIRSLSLEGVNGDSLTIRNGDTVLLTPVVSSKLADVQNEIDGTEGLQYKFVSDDKDILRINNSGSARAVNNGTTKLTVYAYPKNRVFLAKNQNDDENRSILGTEEDAYTTLPEDAIYKKEFTVKVSDHSDTSVSTPSPDVEQPSVETTDLSEKSVITKQNGNMYEVTSASTVAFVGTNKKKARKIVIPKTVKVKGKTYKVTSVASKALSGNRKLRKVIIGKNVRKVSKKAFFQCPHLKIIVMKTVKLNKIGKKAFSGIHKKAIFRLSGTKNQNRKMLKKLKAKTGFKKKTMQVR